jgi:hypothetical protein
MYSYKSNGNFYKLYKNNEEIKPIHFTLGSIEDPITFAISNCVIHDHKDKINMIINIRENKNKPGINELISLHDELYNALKQINETIMSFIRNTGEYLYVVIPKDKNIEIIHPTKDNVMFKPNIYTGILKVMIFSAVPIIKLGVASFISNKLHYIDHIETHKRGGLTFEGEKLLQSSRIEKKLDELKEMLMYMPGSSVFHEAKQDFDERV